MCKAPSLTPPACYSRLYCAHDAEISVFDLACPGTNTHSTIKLTPTRRAVSKGHAAAGQRGKISCLCVAADHFAGTSQELVAVGTFAGTVGIYQMGSATQPAQERCLMGWSEQSAGVTQVSERRVWHRLLSSFCPRLADRLSPRFPPHRLRDVAEDKRDPSI